MMLTLNIIAALVILAYGLFCTINNMTRHTSHGIRFAWLAMTTGSLGLILGPLFGYPVPGLYGTVLHVGIALLVIFERRRPGDMRGMS